MRAFLHGAGRLGTAVLDLLLPPRCLKCGAVVAVAGALCPACWDGLRFIAQPLCDGCGLPLPLAGAPCPSCAVHAPPSGRARAVFLYDDASRALILRFKHADRTGHARPFARWMARAGQELLAETDLIVPVPLHRWRLWRRRYNQAALLALEIGRLSGLPVRTDLLRRRRATRPLGPLDRHQRRRLLRGAFTLAHPDGVAGKRILLVDDVLTSGATTEACAALLRRAGAATVMVLTLARVPLEADTPNG
ncbi:adenine phosphoribosyltransferase [mine drainage metagenome]|uniref:Adenine phosphoribosyltransferase n=1 Tax=mine drainage metagenome TaxID=410659 RepID=A0A1J5RS33_9ZZZZ